MKIGDIVISKHGPLYARNMLVRVRELHSDSIRVDTLHVNHTHTQYINGNDYDGRYRLVLGQIIENPTIRQAAECLRYAPLVVPQFKDILSEWLKQRVIAEFGEPPKKIVEGSNRYAVYSDYKNYAKPLVEEGQVSGFIQINR